MKRVIILVSAMLCLSLAVPGTFSQQPTNPPKQNFQAAKSPVSDDVPQKSRAQRKNWRVRGTICLPATSGAGFGSRR